ncbi:hypothetical protein EF405_11495 [Cyclobacteriaceae bacterium YHN15]|jgi:hypothetical protein|nr:hypothetical protein EF405_11495 [Cyclobacteriaceae bacterium YHN15]
MRTIGIILSIIGGLGLIVFGIQAMEDSESFSILGLDIAVSTANWTPVIVSGVVLVIGLVMVARKK